MFASMRENITFDRGAILVLALIFISFAVSCGYTSFAGHTSSSAVSCSDVLLLTSINHAPMKGAMAMLGLMLLFLAAAGSLLKGNKMSSFVAESIPSRIVSVQKIYNPVLSAIRKGILHSQIYNPAFLRS